MAGICSICLVNRTTLSFHDDPDKAEKSHIRHMVCIPCFNNYLGGFGLYGKYPCPICNEITPHGGWTDELKEKEEN